MVTLDPSCYIGPQGLIWTPGVNLEPRDQFGPEGSIWTLGVNLNLRDIFGIQGAVWSLGFNKDRMRNLDPRGHFRQKWSLWSVWTPGVKLDSRCSSGINLDFRDQFGLQRSIWTPGFRLNSNKCTKNWVFSPFFLLSTDPVRETEYVVEFEVWTRSMP
jgi:hypothetical protein